jgi:hypothetical protein
MSRSRDRKRTIGDLIDRARRDEEIKLRPRDKDWYAYAEGVDEALEFDLPLSKEDREYLRDIHRAHSLPPRRGPVAKTAQARADEAAAFNDGRAYVQGLKDRKVDADEALERGARYLKRKYEFFKDRRISALKEYLQRRHRVD